MKGSIGASQRAHRAIAETDETDQIVPGIGDHEPISAAYAGDQQPLRIIEVCQVGRAVVAARGVRRNSCQRGRLLGGGVYPDDAVVGAVGKIRVATGVHDHIVRFVQPVGGRGDRGHCHLRVDAKGQQTDDCQSAQFCFRFHSS